MTTITYNPFFQPFGTLNDTYPFTRIKVEHYEPAILKGIEEEQAEVDAIAHNAEAPTFQNTIVALQYTGALLEKATTALFNLLSAETSDALQEVARKVSPLLSEHRNNIALNEKLFARVAAVYAEKETLSLSAEEATLLEETYQGFVMQGVNLPAEKKEEKRRISKELSELTLAFSEHLLAATNAYKLWLHTEEEVAGLPSSALTAAREAAKEEGNEQAWLITLHAPSYLPFMKYAQRRDLREQLYKAYNTQCVKGSAQDNTERVKRIVNLRLELAQLLGFPDYATYVLQRRMAERTERVYALYDQLIEAYLPVAQQEMKTLTDFARSIEGEHFEVQAWDLAYYGELLRKAQYDLDSEALRPYLELSRVIDGVFGLAERLYGITFQPNTAYEVYHEDVKTYDVFDRDGRFLAVLYADFHPRKGKRSGAWMTSYKEQWVDEEGTEHRPHVSIVMNFTKPTEETPSLLTFAELTTFLHEFGHALHQILADTHYKTLSGTNVYWDFVELPSQFMENFAYEVEFLHTFARHYQTEELMPETLIKKVVEAKNFHVAYACVRQIALGKIDMAWYTRTTPFEGDVREYEKQSIKDLTLLPDVPETCMTVQFSHIMAGGYAAGYYSYKWAEVLDADAFSAFQERGLFHPSVAQSFRDNVLSRGGTEHPMTLYTRFRGKEPDVQGILKRDGILR